MSDQDKPQIVDKPPPDYDGWSKEALIAALAAERGSKHDVMVKYEAALAAERESLTSALELANTKWIEAQQQLAAERETLKNCEALAKQFVDALKEIANSNEDSQFLSKVADAALEKVVGK